MQNPNRVRVAERPSTSEDAAVALVADKKDFFKVGPDGRPYAGDHLIFDFWGARSLDHASYIELSMRRAIKAAGATLLHLHLHQFPEGGAGVSGVAVLAESHISVHTWPEKGLATFDIFMCRATDSERAYKTLVRAFRPARIVKGKHQRGKDVE